MRGLLALVLVAAALAAVTTTAVAAPPITCGRITMKGKRYVVKSHKASCTTAINGVKRWVYRHSSPRFYACKTIGGDIPAYCKGTGKYKRRYFFASKA